MSPKKTAKAKPAARKARKQTLAPIRKARKQGQAPTSVPQSVYPQESLIAAANVLGDRASVGLGEEGKRWLLSVEPAELLGELLNEALSHARRQARLRENRAACAAIVARVLEKGFPAAPADPLEQLEPQVRLDRAEETAQLLARAAKLS